MFGVGHGVRGAGESLKTLCPTPFTPSKATTFGAIFITISIAKIPMVCLIPQIIFEFHSKSFARIPGR